jgi:hypothetical protein
MFIKHISPLLLPLGFEILFQISIIHHSWSIFMHVKILIMLDVTLARNVGHIILILSVKWDMERPI